MFESCMFMHSINRSEQPAAMWTFQERMTLVAVLLESFVVGEDFDGVAAWQTDITHRAGVLLFYVGDEEFARVCRLLAHRTGMLLSTISADDASNCGHDVMKCMLIIVNKGTRSSCGRDLTISQGYRDVDSATLQWQEKDCSREVSGGPGDLVVRCASLATGFAVVVAGIGGVVK